MFMFALQMYIHRGKKMPNYCENELEVKGPKEELKRFKEFATTKATAKGDNEGSSDNVLDTEKFIPYPTKYKEMDEISRRIERDRQKYLESLGFKGNNEAIQHYREMAYKLYPDKKDGYNSGGYEWCLKNWGTKWGICRPDLTGDTDKKLHYFFQTAWSPPNPIIKKMSEMFPKLTFTLKYWEAGSGFRGIFKVKADEVIKSETYAYSGDRGG